MSFKLIFLLFAFTILISISNCAFFKNNRNLLKNINNNLFKRQRREIVEQLNLKSLLKSGWEHSKSELLADFVEELTDNETIITLVGWQNIHNEDGSLKEINSIELVIPPSNKPSDSDDSDEEEEKDADDSSEEDDGSMDQIVNDIQQFLKPLNELGIPTSGTVEEYDKHGNRTLFTYFDANQLFSVGDDNLCVYNATQTTTPQKVDEFIDKIKSNYKEFGILVYDTNERFVKNKSFINPSVLATVVDEYDISNQILAEAPRIFSNVYVEYPKSEISKQLSLEMNQAFPEYHWRTIIDPSGYYISRDVSINLNYDSFDEFSDNSDGTYMLYGIKN